MQIILDYFMEMILELIHVDNYNFRIKQIYFLPFNLDFLNIGICFNLDLFTIENGHLFASDEIIFKFL